MFLAEKVRHEGLHPATGKQRSRVVLGHNRRAWYHRVPPLRKKIQVSLAYLRYSHDDKKIARGAKFIYYAHMKKRGWGFDARDMDTKVRPQDDFYHYANGGWLKRNSIPPHESRWGSFLILRYDTEKKLRSIVTKLKRLKTAKTGTPEQMVRDF